MARQDRKQREFERRESEILDAALTLLSKPDLESVTVNLIAERAEVGKGTIYKHFASKDELLFRLMLRFYQGLLVELNNTPGPEEGAPMGTIIEQSLRYHLAHRKYRYVVEYCERIDFKERAEPAWHNDFLELDRAFKAWAEPKILASMDKGVYQKRPVEEVMIGMHACFKGAITMLWSGDAWCPLGGDEETIVNAVTRFVMAGLIGQR